MSQDIGHFLDEAERIGNQVANAYDKGFLDSLYKTDAQIVKAFKTRYEAINYQREFGLISEEEYYQKLESIRDRYFSRNSQEWYKYTEEIYNYRKSAIEEYQKCVEENLDELLKIVEKGNQQFEKIQKNQSGYKDKLLDYSGSGTGFDTHTTYVDNYWPTGDPLVMVDYTLSDYQKEIEKLTAFNDSITKLKERAGEIDSDIFGMFFEELREMSVEDANILTNLLLEANSEDFARHFELYDARNTLAENMALSYYSDDYKNLSEGIKAELGQAFSELPENFFEYGQLIADGLVDGFKTEVEGFFDGLIIEVPIIEAGEGTNNMESTVFSPVYYFYGERSTTSRTRINSKNDSLFSYMRGEE